jgi:steroid delta-isomerase-like uncharacterized protein
MDARAIAQRFFDEVVNGRNLDAVDELIAPDFVEHEELPDLAPGREGVKQFFEMIRAGLPDFRMELEDLIAEGDKAVARSALTGTHSGEFMGIPATGRSVHVQVIDIVRISGGRIVEHWGAMDSGILMQQLGAAPPP